MPWEPDPVTLLSAKPAGAQHASTNPEGTTNTITVQSTTHGQQGRTSTQQLPPLCSHWSNSAQQLALVTPTAEPVTPVTSISKVTPLRRAHAPRRADLTGQAARGPARKAAAAHAVDALLARGAAGAVGAAHCGADGAAAAAGTGLPRAADVAGCADLVGFAAPVATDAACARGLLGQGCGGNGGVFDGLERFCTRGVDERAVCCNQASTPCVPIGVQWTQGCDEWEADGKRSGQRSMQPCLV